MRVKSRTFIEALDFGILGEHLAEISYDYWPERPGSLYAHNGDPGDPPEPEQIEIYQITVLFSGFKVPVDFTATLQDNEIIHDAIRDREHCHD